MGKPKRKLTKAQKAEKRRRREEFMTIFIRGKMKRVPRPPTIEGLPVDEFIRRNADPIWLHQNEMWDLMMELETESPDGQKLLEGKEPPDWVELSDGEELLDVEGLPDGEEPPDEQTGWQENNDCPDELPF